MTNKCSLSFYFFIHPFDHQLLYARRENLSPTPIFTCNIFWAMTLTLNIQPNYALKTNIEKIEDKLYLIVSTTIRNNTSQMTAVSSTSAKTRKTPKKWEEDGLEGGPSSMDILLEWITFDNNYARWKGDADGASKQTLCCEIVGLMKEAGIHHRNAADVRTKISSLQTAYNKARDWLEHTGEGIRQNGEGDKEETTRTIQGMIGAFER